MTCSAGRMEGHVSGGFCWCLRVLLVFPAMTFAGLQIGSDIMMALDDVVDSKSVDAARYV